MSLRFWYELEVVRQEKFQFEPLLAALEVDPVTTDLRTLRDGLQSWAERALRDARCDFGLYVADFSAWSAPVTEDPVTEDPVTENGATEDGDAVPLGDFRLAQDHYVRALYIVWSGDGPICVHVDDNPKALVTEAAPVPT